MPFDPVHHELRLDALERIERVIDLLDSEERWCKGKLRTDEGRFCILGAVREADAELLLYGPILRAIREVTGHAYRQIEKFNDSWLTTHALVIDVLERARQDLESGTAANTAAASPIFRQSATRPPARRGRSHLAACRRILARLRAL